MDASTPRSIGSRRCRCAGRRHADSHRPLMRRTPFRRGLALCGLLLCVAARADGALHSLWELHGKHNTVFLLGSIHVLRPTDYPLDPAVLEAYGNAKSVLMEVNMEELSSAQVQEEMLASASLPDGNTLLAAFGKQRYGRAARLAAEAISQVQLSQLGFQPESGVDMYFMERARSDGKSVAGLETVHDQISIFQDMPLDTQAEYLASSLEQAHDLPHEVDSMVRAWQQGDTQWFAAQLRSEFKQDSRLYQSVLGARNRKWLPKIEALLNDDKNYLVIVGTGHLVGAGSVIDLLKKDGIGATQR